MWVLIIVAVLKGNVYLDALPMEDRWSCERQAAEAVEQARKAGIEALARCKQIKIL